MPTYKFKNTVTEEEFQEFMSMKERETFLSDNPHIEPMLTTAALVGDHIVNKMDGGMKETLQKIAEKNPNTPLADRFTSKSGKDVKRNKVVDKYNLKDTLL